MNIIKIGNIVFKAKHDGSFSCHRLLKHLSKKEFHFSPKSYGIFGPFHILEFKRGCVPGTPLPRWAASEDSLIDVACLLRKYHDAVCDFSKSDVDKWNNPIPNEFCGNTICHNDVSPSNIIFFNGKITGLIDFDEAAPANYLYDVALAARHWIPLRDPIDLEDSLKHINIIERYYAFCDSYGIGKESYRELITAVLYSYDISLVKVMKLVRIKRKKILNMWNNNYLSINRRGRKWIESKLMKIII